MPPEFPAIFARLRSLLQKHAGKLKVSADSPDEFCLSGGLHPTHKTPMPVAWVKIGKGYVSFHLMAVYAFPKLLDTVSDPLKKRMQGKSCFNFKRIDEPLFEELDRLTVAGFKAWRKSPFMKSA